jgi:hypothetical protein
LRVANVDATDFAATSVFVMSIFAPERNFNHQIRHRTLNLPPRAIKASVNIARAHFLPNPMLVVRQKHLFLLTVLNHRHNQHQHDDGNAIIHRIHNCTSLFEQLPLRRG